MPGQTGSGQKTGGQEEERKARYVNSDLVHPCDPVRIHAAQCGC